MTKSELVIKLCRLFPKISPKHLEKAVNAIFNSMSETLKDGGRIELRGFGAFTTRERSPRVARNPKTGEQVKLDERYTTYFRAGKKLKDRINKNKMT